MFGNKKEDNKREGWYAVGAALIVLFSAMWDPIVSVMVSIVFLLAFAVNEFRK